jgi:hypothetical protein
VNAVTATEAHASAHDFAVTRRRLLRDHLPNP